MSVKIVLKRQGYIVRRFAVCAQFYRGSVKVLFTARRGDRYRAFLASEKFYDLALYLAKHFI